MISTLFLTSKWLSSRASSLFEALRFVDSVPRVKGKFEHELQVSFIQENVALVPEDDIFAGNNQIFADMRSRLRRRLE